MRRLVILAIIGAAGGWLWKMMTRVHEANVEEEGSTFPQDEDVIDFRARAEAEEETTTAEAQPVVEASEPERIWSGRTELEVGSDWSGAAGQAEEASDKQVRAAIDERLRSLTRDRPHEGRTAA